MASFSSDDSIDIIHLGQITLGDASLEREVLTLFAAQAAALITALIELPADAPEIVHKLKGSARAVGAVQVADAADNLELALREGFRTSESLMMLEIAVAKARRAIDARLRRG